MNYKVIPVILEPFQDEILSGVGMSFDQIESRFGLRSVVKRVEIVWNKQILLSDICSVNTQLELGNTSMTFRQEIWWHEVLAVLYIMTVVMVDQGFAKTPIPDELRQLLS